MRVQTISDSGIQRKEHPLRRCFPRDPTTATAMRLAQLRAEERAAMSCGDEAALREIHQSIARELGE